MRLPCVSCDLIILQCEWCGGDNSCYLTSHMCSGTTYLVASSCPGYTGDDDDAYNDTGSIVGSVFGSIFGFALFIALIRCLFVRRRVYYYQSLAAPSSQTTVVQNTVVQQAAPPPVYNPAYAQPAYGAPPQGYGPPPPGYGAPAPAGYGYGGPAPQGYGPPTGYPGATAVPPPQ